LCDPGRTPVPVPADLRSNPIGEGVRIMHEMDIEGDTGRKDPMNDYVVP
jgi:hypothetical protein